MEIKTGILEWDINAISKSLKLSEQDTKAYFTDGRRVSFILERRLAYEVMRGQIASSEGASYDLIDKNGSKWEVRSISRSGIYFCPSYMVGSGRSFNEEGFLQKLNEINGYIVSDIELFPIVPYWIIPVDVVKDWWEKRKLGTTTKITRQTALNLIYYTKSEQTKLL